MADVNPAISIITLNVNGLVTSIKRQRLLDWIQKSMTFLHAIYKDTFYIQRHK